MSTKLLNSNLNYREICPGLQAAVKVANVHEMKAMAHSGKVSRASFIGWVIYKKGN